MAVPTHVKVIVSIVSFILACAGSRDIFFPGSGVPFLPDDDKLIVTVFGEQPVGACTPREAKAGCREGQMLFVSQLWGSMVVSLAATKLAVVYHDESTFLRRNLMAVLGVSDLIMSFIIYTHEGYFNGQGVSGMGFILSLGIEGAVLLYDVVTRKRVAKKTK